MIKKLSLSIITIFILLMFVGCGKDYIIIEPNETAFLIPMEGNAKNQDNFESEKYLEDKKIATKRVTIDYDYHGTHNLPDAILIKVDRTPVSRSWTENSENGTSSKNEGFVAESKESVSFMARINCIANILQEDTSKFLYNYSSGSKKSDLESVRNSRSLSTVMDKEIRTKVSEVFVEECGKLELDKIIGGKSELMNTVRNKVIPFFKEKGINITALGLDGELTYLDPEIQKSINKKIKARQDLQAQEDINKRLISEAEAQKKSIELQQQTIAQSIQLKQVEAKLKAIEKWNGVLPVYTSENIPIIDLK